MKSIAVTAVLASALIGSAWLQAADPVPIDVYRDPNCGCCSAWIKHLESNGFAVNDHLENDMIQLKQKVGVPRELGSCHTAVLDGRFIEGHVPAADILRMRPMPDLLGLAVPGMPVGSPGMEMGDRVDAYDVIAVESDGDPKVFSSYP